MAQKSPRITFPKVPPYEAVEDYTISKNLEKIDKMHPEFDIVRQIDPRSNLALLRIELHQSEKYLRHRRRDLKGIREDLDKQWQDLEDKEKSLRENFEHFDNFVRENMDKRKRASKKIRDDTVLVEQRQEAINNLTQSYADIKQAKVDMDTKIREYRLYEEYLQSVVDFSEYTSVQEMINRYISLLDAKNNLADLQEENLKALENAKSAMMKLIEEKNFIIMGLNNQIANLQARYEHANIKSLESEQLVLQIKNSAVRQMNEIDEVKSSIWNVYVHMVQSKKHPIKIKKQNIEDQMMYIKRTLTEISKVNQILRKRAKMIPKKQKS